MFPSFCVLFLLASIGLVLGKGSSGRYDILHGTGGESACTLQGNIVSKCTTPTRRDVSPPDILDRDNTILVPSNCTCNVIFFNIWSACSYSTGNSTLPDFTQWSQTCTTNNVTIESTTPELQRNMGAGIPRWATLAIPGNTSFDIQKAVSVSVRWTTIQIILPVIVAVVSLSISGVVLLIYRRKFSGGGSRMGWPKGMRRLKLRTSHKVTASYDRHDSWQIDEDDDPVIKQPPFVNFAPSIDENAFNGQPVRALHVFDPEPTDVHESDKNSKTTLKNEKPLMGTHSFRIPKRLSAISPWKRKPPQIKLVAATSRFRVDDVDKSTCTASGETNTEEGGNGLSQMAEVNEEEPGDDAGQYISPEDEESMDLITPSEREERSSQDVILISKDGRTFTMESRSSNTTSVNSHIKIVSPSVSSTSPVSTMLHPIPTKPTLHVPIPPPPPSHAAPTPPIMYRRATERPNSGDGEQSLAHFLPRSYLSPIREASPAQSFSSSNSGLHRSPALIRRSSNPDSVSSLQASPASRPSPNLSTLPRLPPSYFDLHRTASQSSEPSDAGIEETYFDPYLEVATNGGRDHRLSVDDDSDTSLYCTLPEPGQVQPARITPSDPASFFPAAVRGAGYPRTYAQPGDPF